ncbi:TetR/AcrR family transcriptional regulator [Kitasatospora sp. NPDC059795]|uniref:TetR/AcrR family transcriptional regulator n=1 Tax=Kitasatospora sp. NPDC059795 TaxID=3346949 RepID=UPI003666E8BB
MTRAEAKERNRRALLDAALQVVSRDGHRARLDEIAELAGVTTGAVYSLFGSKNGLVVAVVADYLGPHYAELEQTLPRELDLPAAVESFARHYRRSCDAPGAAAALSLQVTLLDMAVHDADLRIRLAESIRAQEARLVGLFAGRAHGAGTVTADQAQRLVGALRPLFVGLTQGVVLGLADTADEQFFADAARALVQLA